jgi:hypothetical protein
MEIRLQDGRIADRVQFVNELANHIADVTVGNYEFLREIILGGRVGLDNEDDSGLRAMGELWKFKLGTIQLGDKLATTHLYVVGVDYQDWDGYPLTTNVEVFASNRDQARRTAENYGYVVRDVNMVG